MRASVLTGSLVLLAVVLLFLPALGRWMEGSVPEPGAFAAAPLDPRPLPASWTERVERRGWLDPAAEAAAAGRWSSLEAALREQRAADLRGRARVEHQLLTGLAGLRQGRVEEARGRLDLAARLADELEHPLAGQAWDLVAEASDSPERRLAALERLAALRPDLLAPHAERARSLLEAGRPEEALAVVRAAPAAEGRSSARAALLGVGLATTGPGSDERRAFMAELQHEQPTSRDAVAAAGDADWTSQLAEALGRADWQPLLERLEALVRADLAKVALPELEALLAAGPPPAERDEARLLLGRAWRVRKKNAKALTELKKVGKTDEIVWTRARYAAALAASSLKRKGDSRRLLEQAATGPTCLWRDRALERLAERDASAGRHAQARERWQQLAEEAETPARRADAAWRRAWSFFEEGERTQALAAFQQVGAAFPRHHAAAAALYWSQRLLREDGEGEEAQRRLEQLAAEHPWDYYGLLAAQELGRDPASPRWAGRVELESSLAGLLESTASAQPAAAERAAAQWRTGFPVELLQELERVEALPPKGAADEKGAWALRVALLGESGRHRQALVELRNVMPDWRTRDDVPPLAWSGAYPRAYSELVEHHAAEVELDPALVYGLIHQESVFDPDAVSHAGARGLMQIMPGTNKTIARWFKERTTTSDLVDPEHNVRYGTAYLKRLLDNLEHPELALAGYNAGGTRARRWWKALPEQDLPLFVESIPFDETRHYVKSVTWNRHFYAAGAPLDPEAPPPAAELR